MLPELKTTLPELETTLPGLLVNHSLLSADGTGRGAKLISFSFFVFYYALKLTY